MCCPVIQRSGKLHKIRSNRFNLLSIYRIQMWTKDLSSSWHVLDGKRTNRLASEIWSWIECQLIIWSFPRSSAAGRAGEMATSAKWSATYRDSTCKAKVGVESIWYVQVIVKLVGLFNSLLHALLCNFSWNQLLIGHSMPVVPNLWPAGQKWPTRPHKVALEPWPHKEF